MLAHYSFWEVVQTSGATCSTVLTLFLYLKIHKPEGLPGWRIVGFEVIPFSIDSDYLDEHCSPDKEFDTDGHPPQTVIPSPKNKSTPKITWTYR